MSTNLPIKIDEAERALTEFKEPAEHAALDDKLSVVRQIAKKLGLSKQEQDRIAELRINNLYYLGEKLAELRETGLLVSGYSPGRNYGDLLGDSKFNARNLVMWADEIYGWPEAERRTYIAEYKDSETKELTVTGAYRAAKNWRLDKIRSEAEIVPVEIPGADLFNADFRDVMTQLPNDSVEMIFTDPPYDDESAPMLEEMARLSARVLSPGGSLITYFGHNTAPIILHRMALHLRFWWLCGIRHTGGRRILQGKNVRVHWKPLAWYVKDGRGTNEYVDDLIDSRPAEKEMHEWEQGIFEAEYFIRMLTAGDHTILDPFMGSGTTGIAALSLGRNFIGIEIDKSRYAMATQRLREWHESHPNIVRTQS